MKKLNFFKRRLFGITMLAFLALGSVNAQINCPITVTPSATTITAPTTINVNYNIWVGGAIPAVSFPNQYVVEFDVTYTVGSMPVVSSGNHLIFTTTGSTPFGTSQSHALTIPACMSGLLPLNVSISNVRIENISAPPGGLVAFDDGITAYYTFPVTGSCINCFNTTFTIGTLSVSGSVLPSITGTGTSFQVPRFDCNTNIVNSQIYDNGTNVGVGTTNPAGLFHVEGDVHIPGNNDPLLANGRLVLGDPRGGQGEWIQNSVAKNQSDYGISFFTSAAERMRLNDIGLGIGTLTPLNDLDINGSATIGNAYAGTTTAPANSLLVQGNIGIGTTNPAGRLHVEGDIHIPGSNNHGITRGHLVFGDTRGGDGEWIQNTSTTGQMDFGLGFYANFQERVRIDKNGNVGIGISNPIGKLNVDGSIFIPGNNNPSIPNGRLVLGDARGGQTEWIQNSVNKGQINYGIGFYVNTFERMNLSPSSLNASVDILPTFDNSYTLGSSSLRWKEIFCVNNIINTSDINEKTNIQDLKYGIDDVMKLRPVTYNWKENDNGTRIGFIAQELEQVIGEVVVNDEGKYGVRYTEIIPVLVSAIQEQHQIIEELQAKLKQLEANQGSQPSKSPSDASNDAANSQAGYLEQNSPNPSEANTVIKLYVSTGVVSSSLRIYDMTGKEIKVFQITTKGEETKITINKGDLPAGMYMYTLLADGKEVDTKKMIISE